MLLCELLPSKVSTSATLKELPMAVEKSDNVLVDQDLHTSKEGLDFGR